MVQDYSVSKALLDKYSVEELNRLARQCSVDLGWWARFNAISIDRGISEEELLRMYHEQDTDKQMEEWRTDLQGLHGLKKADLLYEYAEGFYSATGDLLNSFLQKEYHSEYEALPIFFLFCHFAELALKATVEYIVELRRELGNAVDLPENLYKTHDLSELLSILKNLFEPTEPFLSEETQIFIVKIHNISEASTAFRYPFESTKKKEKVFMVEAPLVPMGIFKAEFDIHATEIVRFAMWLSHGYIYFTQKE